MPDAPIQPHLSPNLGRPPIRPDFHFAHPKAWILPSLRPQAAWSPALSAARIPIFHIIRKSYQLILNLFYLIIVNEKL